MTNPLRFTTTVRTQARKSPERERRADQPCAHIKARRSRSGLLPCALAGLMLFLQILPAACSSPPTSPSAEAPSAVQPAPAPRHAVGSSRDVIVSEGDWTYAGRRGKLIRTPSFNLHTTIGRSLLLDRLPRFLELSLAAYTTSLGDLPEPDAPLDTFVLRSRHEWESLTRSITGPQAEIYLRIPRGGYAVRGKGVYYDIGPRDTLSIAGHEGWHQYTQAAFAHPLPLWLEEGIGAYFEGFRWHPDDRTLPVFMPWSNPERFDVLRDAVARDELVPLETLLVSRPQDLLRAGNNDALVYYAQVWALAHFLHEGAGAKYRESLARLLLDAAEGNLLTRLEARLGDRAARITLGRRIGDGVFRVYFNDDLDEAAEEYARFVRASVLPGTRQHMTQGRSPITRD